MKKNKNIQIAIIIIILFGITIGYAAINRTLTITGNSEVLKNTWDIHLENVQIRSGSVTATKEPTLENSNLSVDFNVMLNLPGDFYEFTVDVVNKGSIDAMIESITKTPTLTEEQSKYLNYIIEYQNGTQVISNQLIKKGSYARLKVRVEYKDDLSSDELPETVQNLNLSFKVNYAQNNDDNNSEIENNGKLLTVISGNGTTKGNEVCVDTECFYVVKSDTETVTLLAKHNLNIGGDYINNGWVSYGDNITNKQDENMKGWVISGQPWKGVSVYSSSTQKGENYSSYNGSIMEKYVNKYEDILETMGLSVQEARLIYKDELVSLGCKEETLTCLGTDTWIYSTSYWSATPYDTSKIWNVGSDGEFKRDSYSVTTCYGVRPVIIISKSYFS